MPRCGSHDDLVAGDLLDAPARGAQSKDVSHAGLVDHFLVELTHAARAAVLPTRRQEDTEHAAVRDGSTVGHGHSLRAWARAQHPRDAVIDHAGFELREVSRGINPRDQVDDRVEDLPGQVTIRPGAAHHGVPGISIKAAHAVGFPEALSTRLHTAHSHRRNLGSSHRRHRLLRQTSRGLRGECISSMRPSRMRETVSVDWTRSARCLG